MKKLMLAAAIVCAAVMAQAATTNWKFSALNIIGSDNKEGSTYSGTATLYAIIGGNSTKLKTATVADGKITAGDTLFSTDLFTINDNYDFYIQCEDGEKLFTTQTLNKKALDSSKTTTIAFGSQAGNTWSTPEPTSAMLVLIGLAGLALKRKQA